MGKIFNEELKRLNGKDYNRIDREYLGYTEIFKKVDEAKDSLGNKVKLGSKVFFAKSSPGGIGSGTIIFIVNNTVNYHKSHKSNLYNDYDQNRIFIKTDCGRETIKFEQDIIVNPF